MIVEHCAPVRGPVRLNTCTVAIDPVRSIEHNLIDLQRAVAHKNAGRETAYTELIAERITHLAACGCRVRVETVA